MSPPPSYPFVVFLGAPVLIACGEGNAATSAAEADVGEQGDTSAGDDGEGDGGEASCLASCFVGIAEGGIALHSADGAMWWVSTAFTVPAHADMAMDGAGRLVAVGDEGRVAISLDRGWSWTAAEDPPRDDLGLEAIATHAGTWVAVGTQYAQNRIVPVWSDDGGQTWAEGSGAQIAALAEGVSFAGDGWVAVGSGGAVLRSDDAASWVEIDAGTDRFLGDVARVGERLFAVGEQGTLLVSDDGGLSWTARSTGSLSVLHTIVSAGEEILVLGESPTVLLGSSDGGDSWEARSLPTTERLGAIGYGAGRLVVLGDSKPSGRELYYTDAEGTWAQGSSDHNFLDPTRVLFSPPAAR